MPWSEKDLPAIRERQGINPPASAPPQHQPEPPPYRPIQPATRTAGSARPRTSLMPRVEAPARWSGDTFTAEWSSALENAAVDHRKFLQECEGYRNDLMPEALEDLRHSFKDTESGRLVSTAADAYKVRSDLASQKVAAVLDNLAAQADAPGSGSRPIRVRDRLQRAVDKAGPGAAVSAVTKAIADAPDCDLPTLVQEAPAMLKAAGVETGFLTEVIADRVPELAEAMAVNKRAEMSRQCIALNAKRLEKCIRDAQPLRVPLVDPTTLKSGSCDPDAASHVA
jgi:hypothetical protein